MLRTWLLGHRKVAVGAASVAAVCVSAGAVVALDGGDGPDAYVAVGAAGAAPTRPGDRVAPNGKVELVPLDSPAAESPAASAPSGKGAAGKAGGSEAAEGGADAGGAPPAAEVPGESPGDSGTPPATGKPSDGSGSPEGSGSGGSAASGRGDTPSSSPSSPSGPAVLKVGDPVLKDADKRWCQDVTLALRNSGGSAVRSGKVTFETHVIGALGIDWATVDVTKKLPVPIGAGERKRKTWTVCVDQWRVPLGMRLETKDVDVDWK
ncbi:hypothetical protein [Streptomyces endophyticus]|uniref:Secreted protein n=1 Tax=Streptomyces endophyticus TaxID=714166 RepID=A0ABU6FJT9_9ACTN|nr:hypothetical protein [Streptomyces endophyticus]MEB8343862.1 hypothetical protein [Streptomyces endophyticus]